MKILVVDDSKTMRMIISKTLKELGHDIREAGDGNEALTVLKKEADWNVVMVDWNMPGMNGMEFVVTLRGDQDPKYKSIPIIMVTTETELPNVQKALSAGANEFIMKPFKKEAIQEKLALLGLGAH